MIAVIDYDAGNIGSVKNALATLQVEHIITKDASKLQSAQGIIFPGVGAAGEGMKNLKRYGLDAAIKEQTARGTPFLGICLGMQLLFTKSEEGDVRCLDICLGTVKKFTGVLKVPHMGWNQVAVQSRKSKEEALFKNIAQDSFFYFVHSYYCQPSDASMTRGTTEYGVNFCSAVQSNNIYAVQFHPEKSGEPGLQLLHNFIDIVYDRHTSN